MPSKSEPLQAYHEEREGHEDNSIRPNKLHPRVERNLNYMHRRCKQLD